MYSAFIDLKGAFDSVNRDLLWRKLSNWGIDQRLLFLIQRLHSSNTCRIRIDRAGTLTDNIPVTKGVRQGCILAPLLFNLFLADLPSSLTGTDFSPPALNNSSTPLLMYADDALLLSITKLGLRKLLLSFQQYCSSNDLTLSLIHI